MIKQILFDCAGVLAQMKFKDTMLKISGSEEIAEYFIQNIWRKGSPWLLYDKGELSTSNVLIELKKFMPEETLFVDDIFANVEGARNVGMQGYLFTTPDDFWRYLKESGMLHDINA